MVEESPMPGFLENIRDEVMALADKPNVQFVQEVREMGYRLMDDLNRDELYLMLGFALGRIQRFEEERREAPSGIH
jgi:hypothetical protein